MKRYGQLLEYTTMGGYLEADDNQNVPQIPDGGQGGQDMGMGQDMNGADTGMDDPNMGGQDMGMDQGMNGADAGMGDQNMGGQDMGTNQGTPPNGFAPQQGQDQSFDAGTDNLGPEEEDDEVIDVDDLTDSQEDTEKKVDKLTHKFRNLMSKMDDILSAIDANNEHIDALQADMEKRNPTPVEKLTLRSKDSYPFNVSPEQYWGEKEESSNYSTENDENGADDEVYKITKSDVDNISNWQDIYKTMQESTLTKILDF